MVAPAPGVFRDARPLRKLSLLEISGAHRSAAQAGADVLLRLPVMNEGKSEKLGDRFLREIVVGRSETAGRYHKIGRGDRLTDHRLQAIRIIPHGCTAVKRHAELAQSCRNIRFVCVHDIPEKKLGSDAHNLCR